MTPREVAVLLQEHGSSRERVEADSASELDSLLQERTDLLAAVLSSCKHLWSTKSEELDSIAEKLGDGSRDGEFFFKLRNSFSLFIDCNMNYSQTYCERAASC